MKLDLTETQIELLIKMIEHFDYRDLPCDESIDSLSDDELIENEISEIRKYLLRKLG